MELKPQWKKLFKRLQALARQYDGLIFMNVLIVVNGDGVPLYWIPRAVPLEPRVDANIDVMQKNMSEEEMEALLKMILLSIPFQ
jgi:hypothetical protein